MKFYRIYVIPIIELYLKVEFFNYIQLNNSIYSSLLTPLKHTSFISANFPS